MTVTGVNESMVVPLPSWPPEFHPQHFTVAPSRAAHAWNHPRPRAAAPVRPVTATGVDESMVVPSPNSPKRFRPQQTVPIDNDAHVLSASALMLVAPVIPVTVTG